jgi:hypothetical protein
MGTTTLKIVAAATAGYLFGRNNNLKLTVVSTGLIAGRDLMNDVKALTGQLTEKNPELEQIAAQLTEELPAAARELAGTTATTGIEAVSSSLDDARKAAKDASKAMAK